MSMQGRGLFAANDQNDKKMDSVSIYSLCIKTALNNEDIEQGNIALALLNAAIQILPDMHVAYTNRGRIYSAQGRYDLAIIDHTRALELYQDAIIFLNRSTAYMRHNMPEEALADCNQALKMNPRFAKAYNNRGYILMHQGKLDAAIADFNLALDILPQHENALSNLVIAKGMQANPYLRSPMQSAVLSSPDVIDEESRPAAPELGGFNNHVSKRL